MHQNSALLELDYRPSLPVCDAPPAVLDRGVVERRVLAYCQEIGADESTAVAATAWAHKVGVNTIHAINCGKRRAEALKARCSR